MRSLWACRMRATGGEQGDAPLGSARGHGGHGAVVITCDLRSGGRLPTEAAMASAAAESGHDKKRGVDNNYVI